MSNNKTRRGNNSAPARSAAQQPEGAEADRGLFAATVPTHQRIYCLDMSGAGPTCVSPGMARIITEPTCQSQQCGQGARSEEWVS